MRFGVLSSRFLGLVRAGALAPTCVRECLWCMVGIRANSRAAGGEDLKAVTGETNNSFSIQWRDET